MILEIRKSGPWTANMVFKNWQGKAKTSELLRKMDQYRNQGQSSRHSGNFPCLPRPEAVGSPNSEVRSADRCPNPHGLTCSFFLSGASQSITTTGCPKFSSMYKQALLAYVTAERVQRVAVGKSPFALKAVSSELSSWHVYSRLSCCVVS